MYFYHAHALALGVGGKSHAVCALPFTGGAASAPEPDKNGKKKKYPVSITDKLVKVSCDSAESQVSSEEKPYGGADVYYTHATVIIEGLSIEIQPSKDAAAQKVLSTDRLEVTLCSQHHEHDDEPNITIAKQNFGNLLIAGKKPKMDFVQDILDTHNTFGKLQAGYKDPRTHPEILRSVSGSRLRYHPGLSGDLLAASLAFQQQKSMPSLKSTVVCSFVRDVDFGQSSDGMETWGSIIVIPKLATIYLGELVVWPWMRCLNMFRVVPADPDSPHVSGGTVGANGTTYPPTGTGNW